MPAQNHEVPFALGFLRRTWRGAGSACLAGLLLAYPGSEKALSGADPAERPTLNEIEVTTRARQALKAEPRLEPLNLFVSVRQGVATVRGPVPSDEVGRLAVQLLEKVCGIYEVRNDLNVVVVHDAPPLVIPLPDAGPTRVEAHLRPDARPNSLGTLAGRPGKNSAEANSEGNLAPNPFPVPKPTGQGVAILPPVASSWPAAPAVDDVTALRLAVEKLRLTEKRFGPLRAEVRDARTLWVYDDPRRGEEVADFAAALRRLPGVRSVVIKSR